MSNYYDTHFSSLKNSHILSQTHHPLEFQKKKKKNLGRYWARPPSKILPIQSCEKCPISLHKLLMWHPILPLWMNNSLTPMLLKTNTQSQSIKSNSGDKDHGKKKKKKKSVILEFYIYIYICLNSNSGAVLLYLADMIRPINWQQTRTPLLHSHAVVYSNSLQLVLQFHHGNRCSQASIFQTP